MKKLVALGLAVVLLLTFGGGTALAAQPVATGGARIVTGDIRVDFSFTVRQTDGISAQGTLNYTVHNPDYLSTRQLKCDVQYAKIVGNCIWFAAEIIRDSYPEGAGGIQVGYWVGVCACDVSDDPGVNNDLIWRRFFSNEGEASDFVANTPSAMMSLITDGNIQVR